ncbi:MAG TPA: DUF5011 domain-containing protein [Firmicutes bacterium]|nr:DUF5011 domain-containing protein [Bacillota bacterium]
MRRVRIFSIFILIVALAVFGAYQFYEFRTQDYVGPRITMDSESVTVSCAAGDDELLAGVTAEDSRDGDVTSSLMVESKSNFIEKGRRNITIAAFDENSHVTKASREVIYSDYQSPVFSMDRPLKFPVNTQDILVGVTVQDMLDGDLTSQVKISGEYSINVSEAGEYPMVFTVANSAGDVVSLPVTVEIYNVQDEAAKPQIGLSQYLIYAGASAPVNPWDFVQTVEMEGAVYTRTESGALQSPEGEMITEDMVAIANPVDYNTPGTYEITYQITDADGRTGTVRLVTVVNG